MDSKNGFKKWVQKIITKNGHEKWIQKIDPKMITKNESKK
jgi:hypothetical protein